MVYKLAAALKLARTGIYKQQIALLNVRPVNEAYTVEAVRLSNLVETARISETIVPGMIDLGRTRLVPFLQDRQIFVWDGALQKRLLEKALGKGAEVLFYDLGAGRGRVHPPDEGAEPAQAQGALADRPLLERRGSRRSTSSRISSCPSRSRRADWFGEDDLARLQLVALGTIADIMPLRDENRILVRRGLASINKKPRAGLSELLLKSNLLGKRMGAGDIAWQVTPIVNAAGRMGGGPTRQSRSSSRNPGRSGKPRPTRSSS